MKSNYLKLFPNEGMYNFKDEIFFGGKDVTPHNFFTNFFLIHKLKRRPTIKWISLIWA